MASSELSALQEFIALLSGYSRDQIRRLSQAGKLPPMWKDSW